MPKRWKRYRKVDRHAVRLAFHWFAEDEHVVYARITGYVFVISKLWCASSVSTHDYRVLTRYCFWRICIWASTNCVWTLHFKLRQELSFFLNALATARVTERQCKSSGLGNGNVFVLQATNWRLKRYFCTAMTCHVFRYFCSVTGATLHKREQGHSF